MIPTLSWVLEVRALPLNRGTASGFLLQAGISGQPEGRLSEAFFGSPGSEGKLQVTKSWSYEYGQAGAKLNFRADMVVDINQDGFDDVLVNYKKPEADWRIDVVDGSDGELLAQALGYRFEAVLPDGQGDVHLLLSGKNSLDVFVLSDDRLRLEHQMPGNWVAVTYSDNANSGKSRTSVRSAAFQGPVPYVVVGVPGIPKVTGNARHLANSRKSRTLALKPLREIDERDPLGFVEAFGPLVNGNRAIRFRGQLVRIYKRRFHHKIDGAQMSGRRRFRSSRPLPARTVFRRSRWNQSDSVTDRQGYPRAFCRGAWNLSWHGSSGCPMEPLWVASVFEVGPRWYGRE